MMWQSTLKLKACEYVVQHYPLGSDRQAEENLGNAQELIRGAMFVRDGIEEDICSPQFRPALADVFCRVQRETWQHWLWLVLSSIFSTPDPLPSVPFSQNSSRRRSQNLLSALQQ